jgi:hypothetical protein
MDPPTQHCTEMKSLLLSTWLSAICLATTIVHADVYKCIDARGTVSYQDGACPSDAKQSTIQSQAASPPNLRSQSSPSPRPAATRAQGVVPPLPPSQGGFPLPPPRPVQPTVTTTTPPPGADIAGPRATWSRLADALKRGDRQAALSELTPQLQQRFGPRFDELLKTSGSFDTAQLGVIASVSVSGGLAELKVTRQKADGTYAYSVMMIRSSSGKWLIGEM